MQIGLQRVKEVTLAVYNEVRRTRVFNMAARLSYYFLLTFFTAHRAGHAARVPTNSQSLRPKHGFRWPLCAVGGDGSGAQNSPKCINPQSRRITLHWPDRNAVGSVGRLLRNAELLKVEGKKLQGQQRITPGQIAEMPKAA